MEKEITKSRLKKFQESYEENFSLAAQNMVATVGIMDASVDSQLLQKNPNVFSKELKIGKMTNQKQSGRCWMYAGLNTIRVEMMKKWKLSDIQFSHKYLYFYDKLERANQFLEDVISLKDKDLDDRLNRSVLQWAADDGAWWTTFSRLINKYGIVPEYVYPDTKNVECTNFLINNIDKRLRIAAKDIRNAYKDGKEAKIEEIKDEALKDVYKITAISLGLPPKRFDLILNNKDGELIERRNISPKEFFNEFVAQDINKYVELGNYPGKGKEENVLYERDFIQQRVGGSLQYVNVSIERMKEIVISMIDADEPVWFACDVGKDSLISRDGLGTGHMVYNLLNRDALFNIDTECTKVQRLETIESYGTHAMVIVGYDKSGDGLRFKVENSWGTKAGIGGYLVMDEAWFDNFVYEIIPKKEFLKAEELDAFKKDPVKLMPWES